MRRTLVAINWHHEMRVGVSNLVKYNENRGWREGQSQNMPSSGAAQESLQMELLK